MMTNRQIETGDDVTKNAIVEKTESLIIRFLSHQTSGIVKVINVEVRSAKIAKP